jgi:hypothetical protein
MLYYSRIKKFMFPWKLRGLQHRRALKRFVINYKHIQKQMIYFLDFNLLIINFFKFRN